jgi:hypothetical protein
MNCQECEKHLSYAENLTRAAQTATVAIYDAVSVLPLMGNQSAISVLTNAKQELDAVLPGPDHFAAKWLRGGDIGQSRIPEIGTLARDFTADDGIWGPTPRTDEQTRSAASMATYPGDVVKVNFARGLEAELREARASIPAIGNTQRDRLQKLANRCSRGDDVRPSEVAMILESVLSAPACLSQSNAGGPFTLQGQGPDALDAARYRYLRNIAGKADDEDGPMVTMGLGDAFHYLRGIELDEEMDTAMQTVLAERKVDRG